MPPFKFFYPFWSADHLAADFDPNTDYYDRSPNRQKITLWETMPAKYLPMDGVLISRHVLEGRNWGKIKGPTRWIRERLNYDSNVQKALVIPTCLELFGDCGAFSYVDEKVPTYDCSEQLEYYASRGFSLGCTIDHLVLDKHSDKEKKFRYSLTMRNAAKMKKEYDRKGLRDAFELVGVVQGWDARSYYIAAKYLLNLGFYHLAFGGLAYSQTSQVEKILGVCQNLWWNKPSIRIHVFGLSRSSLLEQLIRFGVTSVDGTVHRNAWQNEKNYRLGSDSYIALRVPQSNRNKVSHKPEIEQKVFDHLTKFEERMSSEIELLNVLKEYDSQRFEKKDYERKHLLTLRRKPWEYCDCPFCQQLGIHIVVLRGNERNMRRGFHNIVQFYRELTELNEKELEPQIPLEVPRAYRKLADLSSELEIGHQIQSAAD